MEILFGKSNTISDVLAISRTRHESTRNKPPERTERLSRFRQSAYAKHSLLAFTVTLMVIYEYYQVSRKNLPR